jgi:hypothetical protein
MPLDHEAQYPSRFSTILSIASKTGCIGQTLKKWAKHAERGIRRRRSTTTDIAIRASDGVR